MDEPPAGAKDAPGFANDRPLIIDAQRIEENKADDEVHTARLKRQLPGVGAERPDRRRHKSSPRAEIEARIPASGST